jgi:hypothetical protein
VFSAPSDVSLSRKSISRGQEEDYSGRVAVHVDGDRSDVVVDMNSALSIEGTVVIEGGRRPRRLTVTAEPASASPLLSGPLSAPMAEGSTRFQIHGLRPGEYFLRLASDEPLTITSIVVGGREQALRPFELSSTSVSDVTVAASDRVTAISGTVRRANGALVMTASVVAFPTDSERWSGYGFAPPWIGTAASVAGERYEIVGLPRGDYYVLAFDPTRDEAWRNPRFFSLALPRAVRTSLEAGQRITLDLVLPGR